MSSEGGSSTFARAGPVLSGDQGRFWPALCFTVSLELTRALAPVGEVGDRTSSRAEGSTKSQQGGYYHVTVR